SLREVGEQGPAPAATEAGRGGSTPGNSKSHAERPAGRTAGECDCLVGLRVDHGPGDIDGKRTRLAGIGGEIRSDLDLGQLVLGAGRGLEREAVSEGPRLP